MDGTRDAPWRILPLGQLIDLSDSMREPLNSRERQQRPGPYPYYGAQGVIDHIDGYRFDGRYILVAEDGENLNSKKLPLALFAAGKFWVNNHAHVLRGKPGLIDDVFLLACLNSADIKPFVTGAAQPKLSQANLRLVPIPVPPLPVQRRIAAIVAAYDSLIENDLRRVAILEEMARALYREWFVSLRFRGHEGVRLVDSQVGLIPQGWAVRGVKELAEVTYGFPFQSARFNSAADGIPLIRIRDVLSGVSETYTDEEVDGKYRVSNGHILVGMDGDFHMTIWASGDALLNQRVARFVPKGEIGNLHLFLALETPIQTLNRSIVGTTVAHLGDMHIKRIQVACPPAGLMSRAASLLEPMSHAIINLKRHATNLRRTRDLLLPRLLSGQLDVSSLPMAPE